MIETNLYSNTMKKYHSLLFSFCLMAIASLSNQVNAQSRLAIEEPGGGTTGVVMNNETGGNTIFKIQGSEKMRLTSTGLLGLGTTNPQSRLHIRAFPTNQAGLVVGGPVTLNAPIYNSHKPSLIVYAQDNGASTIPFYVGQEGGTDLFLVYANGNAWLNGTLTQTSDRRLKENITSLRDEQVENLSQVRGVNYEYKRTKSKQLGFIAQELMQVYPELVAKGRDGYYAVNYTGLIPVLVEAIKDLRKENKALKTKNKSFEARLSALEKLVIKAKK